MLKFLQQEAALGILRAADVIHQQSTALMKPFDLTPAQYNVLRILRGSPQGLPCGQISERLISHDPDVTRLLDRMATRGLIMRERSEQDRRVVTTRVTKEGLKLLDQIDPLVRESHLRQFNAFSESQMREVRTLMRKLIESNSPT